MSRHFSALVAVVLCAVLASFCARKGNRSGPGQAGTVDAFYSPVTPPPQSWTSLTERTACGMMDEDLCLGAFGFRVYSDRTLVAGPPSGGGVVSGIIRGRELEILDRDVAGITPTDLNAPLVCRSDRVIPGVDDKVILSNGQRHFVVYEENSVALRGSDCASGDPVKAEKLHADLSAMMREYYPVPFPLGVVARPGSP